MTLPQQLRTNALLTEARLRQLLSETVADAPPRLAEAMRYAVLGSGKRFRPFLVIESAGLFGLAPEAALQVAAAVELVHCYSLVHDDLPAMDDDELRRGRPTVHIAFDEATAILAGDALLTFAFEVLAHPDAHPEAIVRCELALGLARAAGPSGMAGGQQLDLDAERLPRLDAQDLDRVRDIQERKTGALIAFSAKAGAILAAAPPDERRALAEFGRLLGAAFQVADDLLDAEGAAAAVGKATGKDAAAGKATYVSVLGVEGARERLCRLQNEAISMLERFGGRAGMLRQAVRYVSTRTS
ncbi:MAG: polyprenyl synthetase family protein [Hyphomicrobiaceae bacterium]|nr:polyprenyl synthetase family protein [Hyphomicrobiaceae bacterium]